MVGRQLKDLPIQMTAKREGIIIPHVEEEDLTLKGSSLIDLSFLKFLKFKATNLIF